MENQQNGFYRSYAIYRTSSCLQIALANDATALIFQMANVKEGQQRAFNWADKIVMSITEGDFQSLLPIFEGAEEVSIIHKKGGNPQAPSKTLWLGNTNNPKFVINVSMNDQLTGHSVKIGLTKADVYVIKILLEELVRCKFAQKFTTQPNQRNGKNDYTSREPSESPPVSGGDQVDRIPF